MRLNIMVAVAALIVVGACKRQENAATEPTAPASWLEAPAPGSSNLYGGCELSASQVGGRELSCRDPQAGDEGGLPPLRLVVTEVAAAPSEALRSGVKSLGDQGPVWKGDEQQVDVVDGVGELQKVQVPWARVQVTTKRAGAGAGAMHQRTLLLAARDLPSGARLVRCTAYSTWAERRCATLASATVIDGLPKCLNTARQVSVGATRLTVPEKCCLTKNAGASGAVECDGSRLAWKTLPEAVDSETAFAGVRMTPEVMLLHIGKSPPRETSGDCEVGGGAGHCLRITGVADGRPFSLLAGLSAPGTLLVQCSSEGDGAGETLPELCRPLLSTGR